MTTRTMKTASKITTRIRTYRRASTAKPYRMPPSDLTRTIVRLAERFSGTSSPAGKGGKHGARVTSTTVAVRPRSCVNAPLRRAVSKNLVGISRFASQLRFLDAARDSKLSRLGTFSASINRASRSARSREPRAARYPAATGYGR
jgi:hypothetical protein